VGVGEPGTVVSPTVRSPPICAGGDTEGKDASEKETREELHGSGPTFQQGAVASDVPATFARKYLKGGPVGPPTVSIPDALTDGGRPAG